MKHPLLILITIVLSLSGTIDAQQPDSTAKHLYTIINEYKLESAKPENMFWGKSLYVPLLFVNENDKTIYASRNDTCNSLIRIGNEEIYKGKLADSINVADSEMLWNGIRWATIILPLSDNKKEVWDLLAHESFHALQHELNLSINTNPVSHFDEYDGRFWLYMEFKALSDAIKDSSKRTEHIYNALLFRRYRRTLYPLSAKSEQSVELVEGTANYTGWRFSKQSLQWLTDWTDKQIAKIFTSQSLSRNFSYTSGLLYGYLLGEKDKKWCLRVNSATDLGNLLAEVYAIDVNKIVLIKEAVNKAIPIYNGIQLYKDEKTKFEKHKKSITKLTNRLLHGKNIVIPLVHPSLELSCTMIIQIDSIGTIYNKIRISDSWGIATIDDPGMYAHNSFYIAVNGLKSDSKNSYSGKGWKLMLYDGYFLNKEKNSYVVRKKIEVKKAD